MHIQLRISALSIVIAACLAAQPVLGQDDASDVSLEVNGLPDHSPRGALWRAAAVPGWGQIYNAQYYKAPIVWGGLVGIAGAALYVNHTYLRYRHAYHWLVRDDATYDVPAAYEEDYLYLINDLGLSPEEAANRAGRLVTVFEQNRDKLRRNRDLLYIGVGLFYGLSILDAYVSAHLLDFDVSEDLTLTVGTRPGGVAARLRWRP